MWCITFVLTFILGFMTVHADVYLHNPRGSNNRLNEKSAARKNANRLFDSQNNNRGGYNVGDATDKSAGNNPDLQYQMHYFQSSPLVNREVGRGDSQISVEWTNQHGCGGNEDTDPQKQNCNIVLQMLCEDADDNNKDGKEKLRDGTDTGRINYSPPNSLSETEQQNKDRRKNNLELNKGMQEPWESYDACYVRQRNNGLFAADQDLKKNKLGYSSAIHTRQENNGNNRYGYECPEERDYFPYWHPSPWKDIAILAENSSMCSMYTSKSFNIQPYHECIELWPSGLRKSYSKWNNETECVANGGKWKLLYNYLEKARTFGSQQLCEQQSSKNVKFVWAVPYDSVDGSTPECLVSLREPECYEAPWSRSNHLGNGRGGQPLTYLWTLPYFPSGHNQRCVFRIRYNISTDDYDPYNTNGSSNGENSPVKDNSQVEVVTGQKLQMALNTDQTGRVFQDRSHAFILMPRSKYLEAYRIYNVNVRGKRGNIVQVYPAVEYDFVPNNLIIKQNDLVHLQWTGSNTHNNGPDAGDGQQGSDGQGAAGTDRINIAQIKDLNENFPLPFEQTTMWKNAEVMWIKHGKTDISAKDLALGFSSSGYYRCFKKSSCPEIQHLNYIVETQQTKLNKLLDNAPASYKGAVLKFKKGIYHYMCTRNNNFTNRSNKGTIQVN